MSRSSDSKPRRARKGDPLTDREIQILSLVAAGEPTPAISRRLGIADNTVKSHLTNIYAKTGSRNRVQAARHYLQRYTIDHGAPRARSKSARDRSLVQQQMREIQERLDQLAPAATEVELLQRALDALRALDPR
jgi:DNA-binding CsgD family transcriptional regulator